MQFDRNLRETSEKSRFANLQKKMICELWQLCCYNSNLGETLHVYYKVTPTHVPCALNLFFLHQDVFKLFFYH